MRWPSTPSTSAPPSSGPVAASVRASAFEFASLGASEGVTALPPICVPELGRLGVLSNHAGGSSCEHLHELPPEQYEHTTALDLGSMFHGVRAALVVVMEHGAGASISNTSSARLGAVPGSAACGAAKAGMIAVTRSTAAEDGVDGVVSGLCGSPRVRPTWQPETVSPDPP